MALESRTKELVALSAQLSEAQAAREALQAFKEYVHKRLDDAGIPTHPNGEHSAAGCRIGDRLDIVFAQLEHFKAQLE